MNTIIWDLKRLTFIDGEPLKAGLLLRGPTVSYPLENVQEGFLLSVFPILSYGKKGRGGGIANSPTSDDHYIIRWWPYIPILKTDNMCNFKCRRMDQFNVK